MYSWIWHRLPGPTAVRAAIATALVLGVVAVLWFWVYPPLYELLEIDEAAIG